MERLEAACSGKIFAIWGLYALAMVVLTQFLDDRGAPPAVAWLAALGAGALVLIWSGEADAWIA